MSTKVWFLVLSLLLDGEAHQVRFPIISEAKCIEAALSEIGTNGVYGIACFEVEMPDAWVRIVHGTAI